MRRGAAAAYLALLAASSTAGAHTWATPTGGNPGTAATCPAQRLSTPFAQWRDTNAYFLIPGGAFDGAAGWSLSGAGLTAGGAPFAPVGSGQGQSLTITAHGQATSPAFCLDDTMSDVRLFAEQAQPGSNLEVQAVVHTPFGPAAVRLGELRNGSLPTWAPTAALAIPTARIAGDATHPVALRFVARGGAGSWRIDGVYVDPFRAG